jgi:hypothetical protein
MWSSFSRHTKDDKSPAVDMYVTGILIRSTAVGDSVVVYDGQDIVAGRLLHTLTAPVAGSYLYSFPHPIRFEHGFFLDFSANMLEVSVFYIPYVDDPPMADILSHYKPY